VFNVIYSYVQMFDSKTGQQLRLNRGKENYK